MSTNRWSHFKAPWVGSGLHANISCTTAKLEVDIFLGLSIEVVKQHWAKQEVPVWEVVQVGIFDPTLIPMNGFWVMCICKVHYHLQRYPGTEQVCA